MTAVLSADACATESRDAEKCVCETCSAAAPFARVSGAELTVPLADGGSCTYANFDYAASAPALVQVTERVQDLLPYYASVHRGAGYASQVCTASYEGARDVVSKFVGARADDVVVFTRNTTDSLNLLAGCVPGETVVLDIEHHANLLPWKRNGVRVVEAADSVDETVRRVVAELCARPAALLAVTGASNVTGEVLPIARLAEIAHNCGARILVDAAQLLPHRRVDIAALGVDYLAFSGHKLYAPFGAGALVGPADWLDAAQPYLAGGGATRDVSAEGAVEWASAPQRHEAGTPNVLGVAALAAACETLSGLDSAGAEAHERALCERLTTGLSAVDGVRVLRIWSDAPDSVGIVTFTVDGVEPRAVASYLSDRHGIGVRDGRFCAHPLLARLGRPGGAVRASLGLGSHAADVDRLVAAVAEFVAARTDVRSSETNSAVAR
ncbi:aminotransferase class V-fold PLP-dependent enzyme [Rhodococcus spelaei]|uniref:Aminotransferase class V-fold PLP-dependent enzyme n=1 Tax=Rhodococcus spelaei TaxID=2546320 RepID=A0A541BRU0_9NOCA|nr:aminotransferase class V-fold PLP-dependent enzyme [Rhodococcus spelaei]TQF75016.1 aminotransferase class V-fold PLP-dependent enzyme [Rhodococcus spelaei]